MSEQEPQTPQSSEDRAANLHAVALALRETPHLGRERGSARRLPRCARRPGDDGRHFTRGYETFNEPGHDNCSPPFIINMTSAY